MVFLSVLLVLIWSTGFITGKFIVGLIDPNIYLGIRFFFAAVIFAVIVYFQKRSYPKLAEMPKHILAGVFMNSIYMGLSYVALVKGLPAGIMALIGALQPVLVTLLAFLLLKEKTTLVGAVGMLVGFVGLVMVISPALHFDMVFGGLTILTLTLGCLSVLALSFGVTYQKMSIHSSDIMSAMVIQNLSACFVTMGFAFFLGESLLELQLETFLLLLWGIVVLSCGGMFLMIFLVRKMAAAKVSILLLLAPPLAAVESYFLFSETMTIVQIIGSLITIFGVYVSKVKG
ncbi:DMT family transporter [Marinomonas sp. C2222]|uniref:DMT family transporter n=1 Tax=Marinomonas sargassi TaxID=2984494 RepID=A0ABT2YW04_9GAMM|nr:DMT family transporter [Marinomonas sargassi]MCV2403970.1 DMT family transporter [Marinomonas sargassi]